MTSRREYLKLAGFTTANLGIGGWLFTNRASSTDGPQPLDVPHQDRSGSYTAPMDDSTLPDDVAGNASTWEPIARVENFVVQPPTSDGQPHGDLELHSDVLITLSGRFACGCDGLKVDTDYTEDGSTVTVTVSQAAGTDCDDCDGVVPYKGTLYLNFVAEEIILQHDVNGQQTVEDTLTPPWGR